LRAWTAGVRRRSILLGSRADGSPVTAAPAGCNVLVAGPSGSGKSVYAVGILERLAEMGYQYCVVDPEGDYADLPGAVVLGSAEREPTAEEVLTALENPRTNVVISLAGLAASQRQAAFGEIAAHLKKLRATCGRPHWLLAAEAHCLFPANDTGAAVRPDELGSSLLYVSVHPDAMSRSALASVGLVVAMGGHPDATLGAYCRALQIESPAAAGVGLQPGEAMAWACGTGEVPYRFAVQPSAAERRQHRRRLTAGQLSAERSFYFRGPQKKLNLRAQNLPLFMQIGEGVDDETWLHHLRQGDYSRWLTESLKEPGLAAEVAAVERSGAGADATRGRIAAILERFMASAGERGQSVAA
jgi:hypothetical protein